MLLGLMIATVGIDLQSGQMRYTMGAYVLQDGVGFLIVIVGLFALAEVFSSLEEHFKGQSEIIRIKGRLWLTREEWKRSLMPIFRGCLIGFFKGVVPGSGATISTMISYSVERMLSKERGKFGTGMIEGVAGPEAANNAATSGAMVPLLTLGVPSSGAMAVMLSAFIMYGIQPGPLLLQKRPDLVWGLVDSMYIGNIMLLLLNLPLIGLFVRLLYIPTGLLLPLIIAISTIGVYAINGNVVELFMTLFFGVLGYAFRKVEIPAAPLVLAMVLGGTMEQSFRQAMTLSEGNPGIFISSGISITLLALAALAISLPSLAPKIRQQKEETRS
jgi:putative tricarboxylic transport membrane protein